MTTDEVSATEKVTILGPGKPASFFGRQFAPETTAAQIRFDIACGFLLPLACLYFDPLVFRAGFGEPLMGRFLVVSELAMGLALGSLAAWLLVERPSSLLAGFLAGGAVFAGLLGLVMLPYTLIGSIYLIGLLGFSPFVTAFVFGRNAARAYRRSRRTRSRGWVLGVAALGLAVSCAGPWAAQAYVDTESERALAKALSPDPALAADGLAGLKRFCRLTGYLDLSDIYDDEQDETRRQRLRAIERALRRERIRVRLTGIRD
jgi:hypothetical protein